jgi:hypothetical protein
MLRTLNAADIAGICALALHAKEEVALAFYKHFDLVQSPSDPLHLFVLIKELVRAVIGARDHDNSCTRGSRALTRIGVRQTMS